MEALKTSFPYYYQDLEKIHIIDEEYICEMTPLMFALHAMEDDYVHLIKYFIKNDADICKKLEENHFCKIFKITEIVISTSTNKNVEKFINFKDLPELTPLKLVLKYDVTRDYIQLISFSLKEVWKFPPKKMCSKEYSGIFISK